MQSYWRGNCIADADREAEPSICKLADSCYESLEKVLEDALEPGSQQHHQRILLLFRRLTRRKSVFTLSDLRDGFEQFRVWAKNIGVFATDNLSLDFRLKEATDVKAGIISLLDSMLLDLGECKFLIREDRPSSSEEESSDSENSSEDSSDKTCPLPPRTKSTAVELQMRLRTISDAIDRLIRLAEIIRSSNARSRHLKAQTYELWENDVNVLEAFEKNYLPKLLAVRFHLEEPLLSRFCTALSLRRRRFLYQAQHQKRLAYGRNELKRRQKTVAGQNQTQARPNGSHAMKRPAATLLGLQRTTTSSEITGHPRSQATSFNVLHFPRVASTIAPSSLQSSTTRVDVPPPPKLPSNDASHFECPYCCILVPGAKQDRRLWKKHVIDDLQPYICIEPQCRKSDSLFETKDDWVDHQKREHAMEWWCQGGESHGAMKFDAERDFETHLRQIHNIGSAAEIENRKIMAGHPSTSPFPCCPFCDFRAPVQHVLQEHILQEMLRIFLLALPNNDDAADGDVKSDTQGSSISRGTLHDIDFGTSMDLSFNPEPSRSSETLDEEAEPQVIEALWEAVWSSPQLDHCIRETYNAEEDTLLKALEVVAKQNQRIHSPGQEFPLFSRPRAYGFSGSMSPSNEYSDPSMKAYFDRRADVGLDENLKGLRRWQPDSDDEP
ncbi:hypothetical protein LTS15_005709 [Exophiala xenobiotica]|nr:hypothetical protein LTS15_005709 [Exophiala xenobiotica]